jgi:hypothetical protein
MRCDRRAWAAGERGDQSVLLRWRWMQQDFKRHGVLITRSSDSRDLVKAMTPGFLLAPYG